MTDANRPTAAHIPDYLAGIGHSGEGTVVANLSLNENHLGASERAVRAFVDASSELWKYPDGSHRALKEAIARRFGIDPRNIACGAGADELITLLTRLFFAAGDEMVFPEFSFIMFSLNALRIGALPVAARADGFAPSVESILESITDKTRAVFVASPNNPTGTYLLRDDVLRLARGVPARIPLILDGAYAEYMERPDYSDGLDLLDEFPNLVVLRSFSKIHGLASLRVGWCCASREIIDGLERQRGPYNISGAAQAAAIAALADEAHADASRAHARRWRERITSALTRMGLGFEPSGGNFVMTVFPNPDAASRAYRHLRTRGVLTRQLHDYKLSQCLRITIGTDSDNELLLEGLSEFMAQERHRDAAQSHGLKSA